ncbi:hypothetical protein [Stieleria marina]
MKLAKMQIAKWSIEKQLPLLNGMHERVRHPVITGLAFSSKHSVSFA